MVTVPASSDPAAPERPARAEAMRARYPELEGRVARGDGYVAYEVYGRGDPAIMFVPPWQIVHSRIWKAQIPVFASRHRVIAWDNRGNGRSDRPTDPRAHDTVARATNLLAVLDATGTDRAVLVALSSAAGPATIVAAEHPERVLGVVYVCPSVPIGTRGHGDGTPFYEPLDHDTGWAKENLHYWRRDYAGYLEFFFGEAFPEPHSTKPVEDAVGWGLDTDAESLATTVAAIGPDAQAFRALCARITAPVLVIQGDTDRISHPTQGIELAAAIRGAELRMLAGAGHCPNVRDPVRVNLLIRAFVAALPGSAR